MKSFQLFKSVSSIDAILGDLKKRPASHWEKMGEKMAMDFFKFVSKTVPAYKRLLNKKNIHPHSIKNVGDFKKLPLLDKKNYVGASKFSDLFPYGDLSHITTFSATSGSTGEPHYFPRGEEQDWQYEYVAELYLKNQFEIGKHRTLVLIGFGMGIWIGGIFTYKILNAIAKKGYALSSMPIGPNIDLYLRSLKKFGHLYDQVILMGYPPFIKDIIDESSHYGIHWGDYKIRIMTAAEGFSEEFRDYITKKTKIKNSLTDIINIYGTVELGTMAHETSTTSLIRRLLQNNTLVTKSIFPRERHLPTLTQYHPYIVHFEQIEGEVVGTGFGSIPLVRYRFFDTGGVIPFDMMVEKLQKAGINLFAEAEKAGIAKTIMKLPFVYVYERSDFTVIVRGANIYPEEVKRALHDHSLENSVTGKFTMIKKENKRMDEYLEIHVETKKGIKQTLALKRKIGIIVTDTLRKLNSEFNDQYESVPHLMTPRIALWPYHDTRYFKPSGKQQWVKK